MKQPELGKKVTEIRQQLSITQEQLAEECEVSTRTIQRIESGDVDPRAFTIERLSSALEFEFGAEEIANESFWLAAIHFSTVFGFILVPLVIWSYFKGRSIKINEHGKGVLNFQITINLLLIMGVVFLIVLPMALLTGAESDMEMNSPRLILVMFSFIPLLLTAGFSIWQGIANTIRVMNDKPYRYFLSIPFIR